MKNSNPFGFLAKFEFLQNFASIFISSLNPAVIHNLEKYYALKKVHYLSSIEDIEGDYLEFGVFTGSSFCHSLRCYRKVFSEYKKNKMNFYGFDSFEGFGNIDKDEDHPFYTDQNFLTDYEKVNNRVKKAAKGLDFSLVKGFFSESLLGGPEKYGIKKAKIVFIDSDTYSSSLDALNFIKGICQPGTYIILDDYFSYKGSPNKGVYRAFSEFMTNIEFNKRHVFTYGMGGSIFVLTEN